MRSSMSWEDLWPLLLDGTLDTLYMVGLAALFTVLIGLPTGVLLFISRANGLAPMPKLNALLGAVINIGRSLPFIVLLIALIPFTRLIVGTTLGSTAAIVPVTIGAFPFFARLTENALDEVDYGRIEAILSMGGNVWHVIFKSLLPEALPTLLAGITLFLFLGGATLVPVAYKSLATPATEQVERVPERAVSRPAAPRQAPTLSEMVSNNAWDGVVGKMRFQFSSGRIYLTLGLFVLGFIVGRIRLFERLDEFRSRLNRGGLLALIGLGLLYMIQSYLAPVSWREVSFNAWMGSTVTNLINLLTAYLWVVVVIEAYRFRKVQQAMTPLVSYGRMGLTNYIVQSVIGVFIFSGFGLDWSHLGVFLSVLVCLVYTGVQIVLSHYWLKNFRYGPMEWLWRTGTYLKWQPLLR
mgnify:CR=1 FL=1